MKEIRHGIIGCGTIAKWHAFAVNELKEKSAVRLAGCADFNPAHAKSFAAQYENVKAFESVEEMLNSDEIDSVSICTPSGLHAEQAIMAAKAGKHIVVEKPMAITTEQLNAIEDACEKYNVTLTSVCQMRFYPAFARTKKAVESGELGKMVYGDAYMKFNRTREYYASAGWRGTWSMDGGGALMNQGIHGVDLLLYIMGDVKSVYARSSTLIHDIEVEDTAVAMIEYESGAMGVIQGSTAVYPAYPKIFQFNGERGSVHINESVFSEWKIEGEDVPSDVLLGPDPRIKAEFPHNNPLGSHTPQFADFFDAIRTGRKPMIDVKEGRRPVDLILAIYESSRTGKPIDMKEFTKRG